jgi:hypothetical protein
LLPQHAHRKMIVAGAQLLPEIPPRGMMRLTFPALKR